MMARKERTPTTWIEVKPDQLECLKRFIAHNRELLRAVEVARAEMEAAMTALYYDFALEVEEGYCWFTVIPEKLMETEGDG